MTAIGVPPLLDDLRYSGAAFAS
jgi:hypothetical protein